MSKQVRMTARPRESRNADNWVETSVSAPLSQPVKPKRLTIDIDPVLHTRLKLRCVQQDIRIADFLRGLIEQTLDADAPQTRSNEAS